MGNAGNSGLIKRTTNGGTNWISNTIGIYTLQSVDFINADTGWISGLYGTILKTTNGGGPISIKPISTRIPNRFILYQNYPNPFNPSTKINFEIPLNKGGGFSRGLFTRLTIYDLLGREVTTLVNEQLKPGTYEVEWDATNYPSGVYFYKLIVTDASASLSTSYSETKRMVLIK